MSLEHAVEVVRIGNIEKHPNADALDVATIHSGYPCVVKRGQFKTGDLAVYVPVDTLVPVAHPEFAFLAKQADAEGRFRIRAIKLRGLFSMGLLVPAPEGASEGQDMAQVFDTRVYEPPVPVSPDNVVDRSGLPSYTDLQSLRRFSEVLLPGEEVVITEKIHGENGRFCWINGEWWVGSRTNAKNLEMNTGWVQAAEFHGLREKLELYPNVMICGEIYGRVGGFPYDTGNAYRFRAFDVFDVASRKYLNYTAFVEFVDKLGVPRVPELYRGPFNPEIVARLAEGPTMLTTIRDGVSHVREGVVVKPLEEGWDQAIGRRILKYHGQGYLLGK